jgi:capsular polysaccharide biosynthesis protein
MKYILIILLFFIITISFSNPNVQQFILSTKYTCASHVYLTNDLKNNHKQQRLAWGVSTQNELIEIFTTDNKDSWTIIFTNTNGLSCGLVGGEQGLIFK